MTQKEKVLKHLQTNTITSMEAFEKFKITRLSSIIDILRREGYEILSRKPEKGNYSIYELIGSKKEPVKKEEEPKMSVEQTELGIMVKVKDFGWPD